MMLQCNKMHLQLTEILMAQDFQDLTGQIIRRVITLVNEVEGRLSLTCIARSICNLYG